MLSAFRSWGWVRKVGTPVTVVLALFTLPATANDYPESLRWWEGTVGGIDGDTLKNVLFFAALAAFVGFVFGPALWRRRPAHANPAPRAGASPDPRPFLGLKDDELADRFWQASWNVQRMLRTRWQKAPNHPSGSSPRNYFGSEEYARETVHIYTTDYSEEMEALFAEAVRRNYAPRGYGVVATSVETVDDLWCLVYRAGWIFPPLRSGTGKLPTTKPEWITRHIEQGIDYRDTLRTHTARGYEQRRKVTPYQQFALWWYDLHYILRPEHEEEWHRLPLPPPELASPGDPSQLADLIDAALEQLSVAKAKMES